MANVSQYKDLIFEVINDAGTAWSNPNIFIMLDDIEPTHMFHNVSCEFFGEDICIVSGKDL